MTTQFKLTALVAFGAIGLATASYAAPVNDQWPQSEPLSVKVSYVDLNLDSEAGAKVMLQRIRHAAKIVCEPLADGVLDLTYAYRPCVSRATDRAVAALNNPIVTAMVGGRDHAAPVMLASSRR